jgi:cytochrome P450
MALPPGPPLPATLQTLLWVTRPLPFMEACRRRYGDIFTVRFTGLSARRDIVFIADPAGVRTVFAGDPATLYAGSGNAPLEVLLGRYSVLVLDGPEHMRQRKLLLPPLHGERMKSYETVMREATLDRLRRWPRHRPFQLLPEMQRITLEVILRTVFGFDDDDARRDRMRTLLQRMMHFGSGRLRLLAIAFARVELNGRTPWGQFRAAKREVDAAILDHIARRRAQRSERHGDDVLSLLLEARDENGAPMTAAERRAALPPRRGAAPPTTATSLAWAFDLLLHNRPSLQSLIADLEAGNSTWLDATIKETLRIRPVVPIVVRLLQRPFSVMGRDLPAGAVVAPCIYLTQRRDDVFDQPERFMPERFIKGATDPYAWLPFGGGVRRCLGASFASFEMRVVLRTILSTVRLQAGDLAEEQVSRRAVTLVPRHGTRVVCTTIPQPQSTLLPEPASVAV